MNFLEFDSLTIKEFTEALARKEPAPGGGCAAAVAGAMAAGLVGMVSRVAANKTTDEITRTEMIGMADQSDEIRDRLTELVGLDAKAYRDMKAASATDSVEAWKNAVQIPLDIAERSLTILQFAFKAAQWCPKHTLSDIATASALAMAGVEGGASTVETNMSCSPEGAEGESYQARASEMLFQARNLKYELEAVINER
jgi:formiminotetrahydrofolate cyclodeaminase